MTLAALSYDRAAPNVPVRSQAPRPVAYQACDLLAGLAPDYLSDLDLRIEHHLSGVEMVRPGDQVRTVRILLEGWACRHNRLRTGGDQITAVVMAGDLGSVWTSLDGSSDEGFRTLTACRVLVAHRERLADLGRRHPVIAARLNRAARADFALMRNWLINLGQRKAPERLAHLICELAYRLDLAGAHSDGQGQVIPLTQQELADALGMTNIHVNRVLQKLRGEKFVAIRKGAVILREPVKLAAFCDFDPSYLDVVS